MKENIGIIFGGKSVEHEVSIITGLQAAENMDKNKYHITYIYIDKDGDWFYGPKLAEQAIYRDWKKKKAKQFFPTLNPKDKKNILTQMDCLVIAMHGNYGEDGKLQGLLDFLNVPYTSSGVVGSAAGMDKIVMKKIFAGMNLPILPYIWFNREDWKKDRKEVINKVHYTLDYPVFVKPANLGSSIGISMARNEEELINAIDVASAYDRRVLVEKGMTNSVEINCSGLSKEAQVLVSVLEEPVRWESFLSFEDKYIRSNSKTSKGMSSMSRKIPADVNDNVKEHIERYTREIYHAMDCNGVVRIDFILDEDREKIFVNEINTIPGSLSFYLWEPAGIEYPELLDIMITEAKRIHQLRQGNIDRFDSSILDNLGGTKGAKR